MTRLTMRRIAGFGWTRSLLAAALAAGLGGCMSLERNTNVVSPYSDKLSAFNYKEEGSVAILVVGVEGARFIRKEAYFPLFVQVANKSKATFTVTREAFTLEDPLGRQYSIAPAREVAGKYGLTLDHRARQIDPRRDFDAFDLLLPMDRLNYRHIVDIADPERHGRIRMMRSFDRAALGQKAGVGAEGPDVPDPYYGGPDGFDKMYWILRESCEGLLDFLLGGGSGATRPGRA